MRQITLVCTLGLVLSGCSGADTPAATSVVPSPAAVSPSAVISVSGTADDPPGSFACALLAEAVADASLMDEGVAAGIMRASATADAPVADAAERLLDAYTGAVAARSSDAEPDAVAAVSAAAADMSGVCSDSGLSTTG
jgi:phage terminase large subunit-like protein